MNRSVSNESRSSTIKSPAVKPAIAEPPIVESPAAELPAAESSAATAGGQAEPPSRGKRGGAAAALGNKTSAEANRRAAAILEVLAGVRLPSEAAAALAVSVTHYYVLERKALEGLLAACEPQPRGRSGPTADEQVERLRRELAECQRECQRQAALVRATQRAVGLPACASTPAATGKASRPAARKDSSRSRRKSAGAGRKRRRPTARALRAVAALGPDEKGDAPLSDVEKTLPSPSQTSAGGTAAASRKAEQDG